MTRGKFDADHSQFLGNGLSVLAMRRNTRSGNKSAPSRFIVYRNEIKFQAFVSTLWHEHNVYTCRFFFENPGEIKISLL